MSHIDTTLCDGCGKNAREGKSYTFMHEVTIEATPKLNDLGDHLSVDGDSRRRLDYCGKCRDKIEAFLLSLADPEKSAPRWPTDYSSMRTADDYRCANCNAKGVKLWRDYNVFVDAQVLRCAACAVCSQKLSAEDDCFLPDGKHPSAHGLTDQIGSLVPAVPTAEGDTFWGYSAVPEEGVAWWKRLPLWAPAPEASDAEG